ncbi:hypothetical protein [Sedimentitalea nanhaiensis]|uniref:hypothetical protein n=1 Tax=Sedimentitalea nanhaiensis TaxID=999627 RepID=UPI0004178A26|nr:hypothetical protein [Sedimentitalea nanhaiensis]
MNVPAKDRREFGELYTRKKFPGVKGSRRTTRAFRQHYDPMPLDEAQNRLADAMRRAIGDRDRPRLTGIRITAGGGKSTAALRQLGVEKRYMDKIGFMFMADYYVPTHRLGDELAAKAQAEGLDAVVEKEAYNSMRGGPSRPRANLSVG